MIRFTMILALPLALASTLACQSPEERARKAEEKVQKQMNEGVAERADLAAKQQREMTDLKADQAEERADTRVDTADDVADAQEDLREAYGKMSTEHRAAHDTIAQRIDASNKVYADFDRDGIVIDDQARGGFEKAKADAKVALDNAKAKKNELVRATEANWDRAKASAESAAKDLEMKIDALKKNAKRQTTPPTLPSNPRDRDLTPRDDAR